jgi:hypothetical protein
VMKKRESVLAKLDKFFKNLAFAGFFVYTIIYASTRKSPETKTRY